MIKKTANNYPTYYYDLVLVFLNIIRAFNIVVSNSINILNRFESRVMPYALVHITDIILPPSYAYVFFNFTFF